MFLACALSVMALGSVSAAECGSSPVVSGKKGAVVVGLADGVHASKICPKKAPCKGGKDKHWRDARKNKDGKRCRCDKRVRGPKPPHDKPVSGRSLHRRAVRPTPPPLPPPPRGCWY